MSGNWLELCLDSRTAKRWLTNAARLRSTAVLESSLVNPRLRAPLPYTRENPPVRVENPWASQGNLLNCAAWMIFNLLDIGRGFDTCLCYAKKSRNTRSTLYSLMANSKAASMCNAVLLRYKTPSCSKLPKVF